MGRGSSRQEIRHVHFSLAAPKLIVFTCALPLFATVFCVLWSLAFNFEASTRTHCKVYNFLPTVSAVIGGFTPQRYVWQICMALHAPQRLMVAIGYYSYHTSVHVGSKNEWYMLGCAVNSLLSIIEVLSLIGLSMISSTENKKMHENLFICFMACALLHMTLTIGLMKQKSLHQIHSQEAVSLRYKIRAFVFNISAFGIAIYLYYRHNTYCEPGVYSFFALFEYLVIFSNIAFHALAALDFNGSGVLMMDMKALRKTAAAKRQHMYSDFDSKSSFYDSDDDIDAGDDGFLLV